MAASTHTHRIEIALEQIRSARSYTNSLLDGLTDEQWFWMPESFPTHIAWQVGHIAVAQYGLALFRQRGRHSDDSNLMTSPVRKLFMKGTKPLSQEHYPSVSEIRGMLDRVSAQMELEVPNFEDAEMDQPVDPPYAAFPTRYGSLLFAAHHEMLHAGQIGVLRRLVGLEPVR
jgi:hypothetical protein